MQGSYGIGKNSLPQCSGEHQNNSIGYMAFIIDREAGEIIRLVASVRLSVRLSVGALLLEPFDL